MKSIKLIVSTVLALSVTALAQAAPLPQAAKEPVQVHPRADKVAAAPKATKAKARHGKARVHKRAAPKAEPVTS